MQPCLMITAKVLFGKCADVNAISKILFPHYLPVKQLLIVLFKTNAAISIEMTSLTGIAQTIPFMPDTALIRYMTGINT